MYLLVLILVLSAWGVAVGQRLTYSASPLPTLNVKSGIPSWEAIAKIIAQWGPEALIVGVPTRMDGGDLYTTSAAKGFAKQLRKHFALPVHLVDERLTTVEARTNLFTEGGYRKIKQTEVDGVAACLILEQWLRQTE